jgi:DNA-3-methyladenine glycosylase II
VFPADDIGGQNRLQSWLKLDKRPDYNTINRILHRWSPYKGLIYFYMLLDRLEQKKYLDV